MAHPILGNKLDINFDIVPVSNRIYLYEVYYIVSNPKVYEMIEEQNVHFNHVYICDNNRTEYIDCGISHFHYSFYKNLALATFIMKKGGISQV